MSYAEFSGENGGIGFFAEIWRRIIADSDWSLAASSYSRPDWGSANVVTSDTKAIRIDVSQQALPYTVQLPAMFMSNVAANKDWSTAIQQQVDYELIENTGELTILAGGLFDNGVGQGVGAFTVDAGYDILEGWGIVNSSGNSGSENIHVGLRFSKDSSPEISGIEWSLFTLAISPPATDYVYDNTATRSAIAKSVYSLIPHCSDFTGAISITADRIACNGRADCFSSWCVAGIPKRVRPIAEQAIMSGMMGTTSRLEDRAGGPVGKTNEGGRVDQNDEMGCFYLFDKNKFADTEPVELNGNRWVNEVGHPTDGYTASRRALVAASELTPATLYFEAHNVITSKSVDLVNNSENVIYGIWDGIYTVLVADPSHGAELTMDTRTIHLWGVGDSLSRFVGVEDV